MRHILTALALTLLACDALAAPWLDMDPHPLGAIDSASFTTNGGTPRPCELTITTEIRTRCDLRDITEPGTYVLVVTLTKAPGCTNTTLNVGECTPGGSVSSANFSFTRRTGSVDTRVLRVAP